MVEGERKENGGEKGEERKTKEKGTRGRGGGRGVRVEEEGLFEERRTFDSEVLGTFPLGPLLSTVLREHGQRLFLQRKV